VHIFIPYVGDGDTTIYISSPRLTYKYKYRVHLYCGSSAVLGWTPKFRQASSSSGGTSFQVRLMMVCTTQYVVLSVKTSPASPLISTPTTLLKVRVMCLSSTASGTDYAEQLR
jgi:hypothetical protein